MASPVTPSDFQSCISNPAATMCQNFINTILKLPVLIYRLVSWMLDADGNPTDVFLRSLQRPGDLIFSAAPLAADTSRLLCNGAEVSQTTYPELYAAIGTIYGSASAGLFKLPDYRAKFPVGVGTFESSATVGLGEAIGEEKHVLAGDEFIDGDHIHAIGHMKTDSGAGGDNGVFIPGTADPAITGEGRQVTGVNGSPNPADFETEVTGTAIVSSVVNAAPTIVGHNNLPPGVGCYIYIKT